MCWKIVLQLISMKKLLAEVPINFRRKVMLSHCSLEFKVYLSIFKAKTFLFTFICCCWFIEFGISKTPLSFLFFLCSLCPIGEIFFCFLFQIYNSKLEEISVKIFSLYFFPTLSKGLKNAFKASMLSSAKLK